MLERMLLRFPVRLRVSYVLTHSPRNCAVVGVGVPLTLAPALLVSSRSYATPGRPKSVVGEPSRPVKRAVKKAAAKPADGTSAAEQKTAAKKKTRALTPEQAASRQAAENKKAARQAALSAKAALRKASEEQKVKLDDLQAAALPDAPRRLGAYSAYHVYLSEVLKGAPGDKIKVTARTGEAAEKWKELSPAELEHYNHELRTRKEASAAAYQQFIDSHTPEQIQLANKARAQLRSKLPKQKSKWIELEVDRRPKRPVSPYLRFSINRQSSGDFANIKLAERARLIGQEWKALSESEKKKYQQMFVQDNERWIKEYTQVYGKEPAAAKKAAAAVTA